MNLSKGKVVKTPWELNLVGQSETSALSAAHPSFSLEHLSHVVVRAALETIFVRSANLS